VGKYISEDTRKSLKVLARVSTIGFAMALAIVFGLVAGYFVDEWLGTSPWGFFVGMGCGIAAAFRNLYVIAKRLSDEQGQ
jgi:ATP synthase protein I